MRKVAATKGAKKKCDVLYSRIIRARGACELCGKTENLQCAHIISRRFSRTRCDLRNALCLCAGCHHYYTDHPYEWAARVDEHMVGWTYIDLWNLAHRETKKVNWNVIYELLCEEAARIGLA